MKTLILTLLAINWVADVFAQGWITAANGRGTGDNHATSLGLYFDSDGTPYTGTRINMTLLGGPNAGSLSPLANLTGANALFYDAPGAYLDDTGGYYVVPGVAACTPATLRVLAWVGTAPTFSQAAVGERFFPWNGSMFVDASIFTFSNPTSGECSAPPDIPKPLDGMPAMQLGIPEPSTIALACVGATALLLLHRRKSWACRRVRVARSVHLTMASNGKALRLS